MPEAHMKPVSCYLPPPSNAHPTCIQIQNAQNFSLAAATSELSIIISDTHFCKPRTKDQLFSKSELNTVRLKCPHSFREWKY
uniref:Uncharacterized protein n=1 Tax=Aotus nancymaae TaxID=37293 RepID=A0A2K5CYD9_AOTNA